MYNKLFSEGKIGNLKLKNRLVMSPMGIGLAELDGSPSKEMIAFYEERAKGGAGLIIPEITRINDETGVGLLRQLSVTKDRHIEPLSRMAAAIHSHDCKIFIQLHHPGREGVSALIGNQPVVAPSAIMCKSSLQETRALTNKEVKQLIQQFIDGAVRVHKAGCDGVELHAAHGYLINQFLSPYTNKREDEYGGNFENRMRFISEIIEGIKKECGRNFPIGVRLTVDEFLSTTGVTEDYIHLKDGILIAKNLEALGIDFLDVSCGIYETGMTCVEPISFEQGWRYDFIKAVKEQVHVPIIAVSTIREPSFAEKFLEDGVTDFVSLGRSWLADDHWGEKVRTGHEDQLCKCVSCLRCFESLGEYNIAGYPAECAVNPRMARELKYGLPKHDAGTHKVVVVGGGPGGMSAARTLAERGIKVTLLEKSSSLGGLVSIGKEPPHKQCMNWIMDYYTEEFSRLGVKVKLNTEATVDSVKAMSPDSVVVATGSTEIVPNSIPGVDGKNVYSVEQVLNGTSGLKNKKIVLVGAGMTGLETAEYLCDQKNEVTVVDMLDKLAPEGFHTNVLDVTLKLKKYGVKYLLSHLLKEIEAKDVVLEELETKAKKKIECDAVVLSLGQKSDHRLYDSLKEAGLDVHLVGDAVKVGRLAPAIKGGFEIGRKLFTSELKGPSFIATEDEMDNFAKVSNMKDQEGVYLAYLTDPEAIKKILPKGLTPFSMPVMTLSVCHVKDPSFAKDYYEAILGCYAMHGKDLGAYCIALALSGNGSEMATQLGRDNAGIPKKLGATCSIKRDGDCVSVSVSRKGTQLVDATMVLGEYNNAIADALYQSPKKGKTTYGYGYYYMFDRECDEEGKAEFTNARLVKNLCQYNYKSWEPGFTALHLKSSEDDPWASFPINTVIGGAYSTNDLLLKTMSLVEKVDCDEVIPKLLKSRYDRTAFMIKNNI